MELEKIKELLDKEPEDAVDEILADVEKRYGEIPYITNFMKDMPEIFISRMIYENSVMREFKRMDPKTVELISIAVASALRCEHCLKTHVRVAKRLGVSKEEIFDSVLIASSVSTAAVLAEGTRSVDSVFTEDEQGIAPSSNCTMCNINSELPEED
ncbi:carboxymuconolactone decarboxylase family protein [Methanolobus vulcani]|jgi:AhpD family alkylhydroperoxidase|uniref:Carboxymuconolactone decarboxylase family protein n=1 Tax=Methanolobus vulcani TaxID=38026 RepID=A0A7Z8KQL8_9EURY|nr:carboxymuconolactone decarboxylase family protein [Methanolobus vulcani]TQD28298.1 carboxymuconolactone decarboxylase family protein [Methanolobus vulcani]